jgi:hypothetical protein
MYVCTYVCMYVCMHACVCSYACMHTCVCVCAPSRCTQMLCVNLLAYAHMYICMYACMYTCVYTCLCDAVLCNRVSILHVHMHMYVCVYAYMYACSTCMLVSMHASVRMHTFTYVRVCVHAISCDSFLRREVTQRFWQCNCRQDTHGTGYLHAQHHY